MDFQKAYITWWTQYLEHHRPTVPNFFLPWQFLSLWIGLGVWWEDIIWEAFALYIYIQMHWIKSCWVFWGDHFPQLWDRKFSSHKRHRIHFVYEQSGVPEGIHYLVNTTLRTSPPNGPQFLSPLAMISGHTDLLDMHCFWTACVSLKAYILCKKNTKYIYIYIQPSYFVEGWPRDENSISCIRRRSSGNSPHPTASRR